MISNRLELNSSTLFSSSLSRRLLYGNNTSKHNTTSDFPSPRKDQNESKREDVMLSLKMNASNYRLSSKSNQPHHHKAVSCSTYYASSSPTTTSKITPKDISDILEEVTELIEDTTSSTKSATASGLLLEPTPIHPNKQAIQVVSSIDTHHQYHHHYDYPSSLSKNNDLLQDFISIMKPSTFTSSVEKKRSLDDSEKEEVEKQGKASKKQKVTRASSPTSSSSSCSSENEANSTSEATKERFRVYQAEQWYERFQELIVFQSKFGHCLVPHIYNDNPTLSQWVKRQRYQYKLKREGKHSTLTQEREDALQELGFVWDSHFVAWMERFEELKAFKQTFGHSNVPINYPQNRPLSIWVKCQRRQFKLFCAGQRSNMTPERIEKLRSLDFCWNPRGLSD